MSTKHAIDKLREVAAVALVLFACGVAFGTGGCVRVIHHCDTSPTTMHCAR